MLEVRDLSFGHDDRPVMEHVSFGVGRGETLVLLGPNGVGKTTLFKTMLGLLPRMGGDIFLDGEPLDMRPSSPAMKRIAYVPQAHSPAFAFTVLEITLMGRTSRIKLFATPTEHDRALAMQTLDSLGLAHLAERPYTQVSGGERQMILIARALVQQPDVLVMDEPAASLDFGNQARLLRTVRHLARDGGLSVLMTTHNPDHALMIANTVLLFARGTCVHGDADAILTSERLSEAYGTPIEIIEAAQGSSQDVPLRSCVFKL